MEGTSGKPPINLNEVLENGREKPQRGGLTYTGDKQFEGRPSRPSSGGGGGGSGGSILWACVAGVVAVIASVLIVTQVVPSDNDIKNLKAQLSTTEKAILDKVGTYDIKIENITKALGDKADKSSLSTYATKDTVTAQITSMTGQISDSVSKATGTLDGKFALKTDITGLAKSADVEKEAKDIAALEARIKKLEEAQSTPTTPTTPTGQAGSTSTYGGVTASVINLFSSWAGVPVVGLSAQPATAPIPPATAVTPYTSSTSFTLRIHNGNAKTVSNIQLAVGLAYTDANGTQISTSQPWLQNQATGVYITLSSMFGGPTWTYNSTISPNVLIFGSSSTGGTWGFGAFSQAPGTMDYTVTITASNVDTANARQLYFYPMVKVVNVVQ